MNIRILVPEDAEQYRVIRLAALQNSPEAFGASFEEEKCRTVSQYKERFLSDHSFTLGSFDGEKLIGIVTFIRENRMKLRHKANIVAMYVSPEQRGLGIGKSLMKEVINKAKQLKDVEQINISVVTENDSAKTLYSKLGFEVFGTEKRALKWNHTYFDEDHMVLYL